MLGIAIPSGADVTREHLSTRAVRAEDCSACRYARGMTDEGPRRRRLWVQDWMRQEEFWRQVAVQAVGGLVVVLIAGISAGAIAWAVSDSVRPTLILIGLDIVAILLALGFAFTFFMMLWSAPEMRGAWAIVISAVLLPVATIGLIWILIDLVHSRIGPLIGA